MGEDGDDTHRIVSSYLDIFANFIHLYHGRVGHFSGDAVLADFDTVVEGVSCAVDIQRELGEKNEDVPEDRRVQFRIGVNLGDVIVDRGEVHGDGVNVAARLESLAGPGGICISASVYDSVGSKLPLDYEYLGERRVKNIEKPLRAYHARLQVGAEPSGNTGKQQRLYCRGRFRRSPFFPRLAGI